MALDYGDVRIGIAMSDLLQTIASPYQTYKRKNLDQDLKFFKDLIEDLSVTKVVIGLPVNMDGTEGERAFKTRQFGEKLNSVSEIEIEFVDERLTSVEAEEILIEAGVKREKRKEVIDKIAAALILESYLNRKTY